MADNNKKIEVTILNNTGTAYYVYFTTSFIQGNPHYKRFKLDDSTYNQTFPNLVANNWYNYDDIVIEKVDEYGTVTKEGNIDTYIGMKVKTSDSTLLSIIYTNKLLDYSTPPEQYRYAFITDSSITNFNQLILGNKNNGEGGNWLFKIELINDTETLINQQRTYIVDFLLTVDDVEHPENLFISYHEVDVTAHQKDLAYFVSDRTSDSIISERLWRYNNATSYEKLNGIYSSRAYTHRLKYAGTPLTVDFQNYAFITKAQNCDIVRESSAEVIGYYNDNIDMRYIVDDVRGINKRN